MHTALDRAARSPRTGAGLVLAAGALLAGAVFFGGGSGRGSVLWLGGAAALALTAGLVVALLGRAPAPAPGRAGLALLGSLGVLVLWEGLSVLWSVAPDRSWDSFNKSLAAACFLGLGLAAGSLGSRALRLVAAGLAALLGAALAWSLAGKAIPALFPDGARAARLRSPVGYWNALALLGDLALPLGLWLAVRRDHARPARAAGVALVYAATLAVLLAASRTGVLAGALGLALWLLLARERVEGALAALAGIAPAAAVAAWAFTRPALVDDLQPHAARVGDGAWFGLLALTGAAAAAALAHPVLRRPLPDAARRSLARALALVAALAAAAALVGLAVRVGNPATWAADQFRGGAQVSQGPGGSRASSRTTAGSGGRRLGASSAPTRPRARERAPSRWRASATARTGGKSPSRTTSRSSSSPTRVSSASRSASASRSPARPLRAGRYGGSTAGSAPPPRRSPSRPPPTS